MFAASRNGYMFLLLGPFMLRHSSHDAPPRTCCCLFRYELLDEAMDNGYPQITDHTILTSLITQRGFKGDIADLALDLIAKVRVNFCLHVLLDPCSIQQIKSTKHQGTCHVRWWWFGKLQHAVVHMRALSSICFKKVSA
jgi:hypothetical protein